MISVNRDSLSPMMQQYYDLKMKFKDAILLFRLGDFYEMFFDDAIKASKALEIVLTRRECGLEEKAPMCGIPHHVSDTYINKLVSKGFKVALCEQLEDPKMTKGLVKRDVIRVVSPGTNLEANHEYNNYLMCIYIDKLGIGISYVDVGTGKIQITENNDIKKDYLSYIQNEISRINPSELLIVDNSKNIKIKEYFSKLESIFISYYLDELPNLSDAIKNINSFFPKKDTKELLKSKTFMPLSLSILLKYVHSYHEDKLKHINLPVVFDNKKHLEIDFNSRKNLNLFDKEHGPSLFKVLNQTKTPMGSRKLIDWIENPLLNIDDINNRLDKIDSFIAFSETNQDLDSLMENIYDIERIIGKLSYSNANPRDLVALKNSIVNIPIIKEQLSKSNFNNLIELSENIDNLKDIYELLDASIIDEAPITSKEGNLIKENYSEKLDEIRNISLNGKSKLIEYEVLQKEKTGIKNLKIVYNKKTGYFIDVTKSNLKLIADDYKRVQTLTNSERFITDELSEIQDMIFNSETEILQLEEEIFKSVCTSILNNLVRIQNLSNIISEIDVLNSLATVAKNNNFVRPLFSEDLELNIEEGRHPVIEDLIGKNSYISNNTEIGKKDNLIHIITGPNMSGKSTYLRQVALISVMAQIGSFVPCKKAKLAIVDKIFTRIGAQDNILFGDSTFMVEMKEMAYILKNASNRSLILLDEVGRGTSTYDGLSLAWAIIEYLSSHVKAKTLFATHYHEITQLEDILDNLKNYSVQIEEENDSIIFLHKIVEGAQDKSFGIEVAKLAGFPNFVLNRAKKLLSAIESKYSIEVNKDKLQTKQIDFVNYQKDSFIKNIQTIDINKLSPLDALNTLSELISESKILGEYDE